MSTIAFAPKFCNNLFQQISQSFLDDPTLAFAKVLSAEVVEASDLAKMMCLLLGLVHRGKDGRRQTAGESAATLHEILPSAVCNLPSLFGSFSLQESVDGASGVLDDGLGLQFGSQGDL